MAKPWEKYQTAPADAVATAGPWQRYGQQPEDQESEPGYWSGLARTAIGQGAGFGFGDEIAAGFRSFIGDESYREALEDERKKIKAFAEENPMTATAAEIGGAVSTALVPFGLMARGAQVATKAPSIAGLAGRSAAYGAPAGGLYEVGKAETNDPGELGTAALRGGVTGAVGGAVLGPTAYGVGRGVQSLGRAVRDAANPRQAAYRKVARTLDDAQLNPTDLRKQIAPAGRESAARRKLTDAQVSDIIRRQAAGEPAKDIAKAYGVSPKTVSARIAEFNKKTETPLTLIDAAKLEAQRQGRTGAADATGDLARAAAAFDPEGRAVAKTRLTQRQLGQGSRLGDRIAALVDDADMEDRAIELSESIRRAASKAYDDAYQVAKPIDLRPAIQRWRRQEFRSAGKIKKRLGDAIDLFYRGDFVRNPQARDPMSAKGLRYSRFAEPINDLRRFQGAKEALDQMIEESFKDHKPTQLTRLLQGFKKDVLGQVRQSNPKYIAANAQFADGKAASRAFKMGTDMTGRAGGKARDLMRRFNAMSDAEKDMFRLGFAQDLMDKVANKRDTVNITLQFQTPAARSQIRHVFGDKADDLLEAIEREATGTETLRQIFSGSRTTPLAEDIEKITEGAELAGDAITGNLFGVLRKAGQQVGRGIGQRQSREILDISTATAPDEILKSLDALRGAYGDLRVGDALKRGAAYGTAVAQPQRRIGRNN